MKRLKYHLHHIIGLQQYLVVPESQNPEPGGFEVAGALGVIPGLFLVLAAINLDHKFLFQADEIHYVWAQWMLSSEFERFEISVPQQLPEAQFGIGEGLTHSSRAIASG